MKRHLKFQHLKKNPTHTYRRVFKVKQGDITAWIKPPFSDNNKEQKKKKSVVLKSWTNKNKSSMLSYWVLYCHLSMDSMHLPGIAILHSAFLH